MSFESTVGRFHKTMQTIAELKEALDTLKRSAESQKEEIIGFLADHSELYNVSVRRKESTGIAGNLLYKTTFGEKLVARSGTAAIEDKEFVEKMREVSVAGGVKGADYVRIKYEVNKAKLAADIKAGVLGKADLTKLNIALEPTVNFKVDRVKTEKELYDLKAAAMELAESVE